MTKHTRLSEEQRIRLWDSVWRTYLLPLTHQATNAQHTPPPGGRDGTTRTDDTRASG